MPRSKAFGKTAVASASIAEATKPKPRPKRKTKTNSIPTGDAILDLDARARAVLRRNRIKKKITMTVGFDQYKAIVEFSEARDLTLRETLDYIIRLGLRATAHADSPVDDGPFGLPPANGHARPMETFRDLVVAGRASHDVPLETYAGKSYRESVLAAQREAEAAPLRELAAGLRGMLPASMPATARYPMPEPPAPPPATARFYAVEPPPSLFADEPPPEAEPVLQTGETDG